jgi:hypothetical protein
MSGLLFQTSGQPSNVSVKVACQGPTGGWVVRHRDREYRPCVFDARDQHVWIVCRGQAGQLSDTVKVGDLALLACDSAVVITAWSPESFAPGLSTQWTGGALVPNSGRVVQPDPAIGNAETAKPVMLPQGYERNEGGGSPQTSDEDEDEVEDIVEDGETSDDSSDDMDRESDDNEDMSLEPVPDPGNEDDADADVDADLDFDL